MQTKRKHRFLTIFILLFPENVPNVKVFTKNRSVLLFVPWTVVFRMMITWKVKKFCWNVKRFYTTNNIKASIYAKLFLFLSHKTKAMKKLFALWTLVFLTISCAVKKEIKENQTTLNGTWELASASFSKDLSKDFKEGLPTLTFDSSENLSIFGYDGCNRIRTKATLQKEHKIFIAEEITSTMMACNKVKSNDYKQALVAATHYELKKDNVLFLKSDSDELQFHKVTLNGNWYLDKIYVRRIKAPDLYPFKKPFIKIVINQPIFSGSTACNLLNGQL